MINYIFLSCPLKCEFLDDVFLCHFALSTIGIVEEKLFTCHVLSMK
jgi:hypothetical protein